MTPRIENFIDSSSKSLKAVLLHNGNKFASITERHSIKMRETHNSMEALLSALKYKDEVQGSRVVDLW